jgi:hypothetical protein
MYQMKFLLSCTYFTCMYSRYSGQVNRGFLGGVTYLNYCTEKGHDPKFAKKSNVASLIDMLVRYSDSCYLVQ